MSDVKWMCAPSQIGESVALSDRLDRLFKDSSVFGNAQPMTVRVRGVMILEKYDWLPWDKNDVAIVTTSQFGNEPPVQRLHFLQKDVEKGWQGDFFNDVVLTIRDFNVEKNMLIIRIQVYDMDGIDPGLIEAVSNMSKSVAVTFPHLAPYAASVSFGSSALLKLVENINNHDQIIDERLTLEVMEPEKGHKLLQPGYFVCFNKSVGEGLSLNSNLTVLNPDQTVFEDASYAVLEVEREYHGQPLLEIDQKAAKLIAELNGKGQSGKAALDFLRDTIDYYNKYKKLERIRDLKSKEELSKDKSSGVTFSDEEDKLLKELAVDTELAPFLTGIVN